MTEGSTSKMWSRKQGRQPKHSELFVALILLLVVQSFLTTSSISNRILFDVLFLAVILSTIRSFSRSRRRMLLALTLGGIAVCLMVFVEFRSSTEISIVMYSIFLLIFLLLEISLIEDVFVSGPVNTDRLVGAACIYFVLAIIWALAFSLLETVKPGSFLLPGFDDNLELHQGLLAEFFYFSNVTLTTLGYGDIVPISRPARMFASIEAMFGQLFVAIVIGRLVGLHLTEKRMRD
ncbi:MAG: potassium channel family protein [Bythopirellula sp.]